MTYSGNDSTADTLGLALEILRDEAMEYAETDGEREAIEDAFNAVVRARAIALQREYPTPTQQLIEVCGGEIPPKPDDPRDTDKEDYE